MKQKESKFVSYVDGICMGFVLLLNGFCTWGGFGGCCTDAQDGEGCAYAV